MHSDYYASVLPSLSARRCDGDMCNNIVRYFEDDDLDPTVPLLCMDCKTSGNQPAEWDDRFIPLDRDVPEDPYSNEEN